MTTYDLITDFLDRFLDNDLLAGVELPFSPWTPKTAHFASIYKDCFEICYTPINDMANNVLSKSFGRGLKESEKHLIERRVVLFLEERGLKL